VKFEVKHHWWIWVVWILWHFIAARFLTVKIWYMLWIALLLDFIVIFPEASHFKYEIKNRQFTVKRIVYSDISFPCTSITSVEDAKLFTTRGMRMNDSDEHHIVSRSLGTYKITYIKKRRNNSRSAAVLVSPKDKREFIRELSLNVSPEVILVESAEKINKK